MASEYLLKKAREQKPAEPTPELTPAEKRKNWWHYHKWWVLVGLVLLWIVGSMLWGILGIGKTKPDYIFAYVGGEELSQALVSDLERELAALGSDVNGDGKVKIELRQYATNRNGDAETAAYYNYAADTRLLADVTKGESYFFLVEDPEGIQRAYELFANADGSAPEDGDWDVSEKVCAWADCPVLTELELDQTAAAGLYLGRRCFYGEEAGEHTADDAFWRILTKGAHR